MTLTNCTLADNSANSGGGIINRYTATLKNNIVANSLNGTDIVNQRLLSGSNNLVEDGSGLPGWLTGDPGLGELKDNGGPTQTMALLPGSPAIDAGSNALALDASRNQLATTDQRGAGYARISGSAVDVGAYEFQRDTPTTIAGPSTFTPVRGQIIQVYAVVQGRAGGPAPTGTVGFFNGTTLIATEPLVTQGGQTFATLPIPAGIAMGTYTFRAVYNGDANYVAGGATTTFTVGPDSTTTVVGPSDFAPVRGESLAINAIVAVAAPGSGTPTGTVTFKVGSTVIATEPLQTVNGLVFDARLPAVPFGLGMITRSRPLFVQRRRGATRRARLIDDLRRRQGRRRPRSSAPPDLAPGTGASRWRSTPSSSVEQARRLGRRPAR